MKALSLFFAISFIGCVVDSDVTIEAPQCEFQKLTRIEDGSEGFISKCEDDCCLWVYNQHQCVEQWCLDEEGSCGWSINDWGCWEIVGVNLNENR